MTVAGLPTDKLANAGSAKNRNDYNNAVGIPQRASAAVVGLRIDKRIWPSTKANDGDPMLAISQTTKDQRRATNTSIFRPRLYFPAALPCRASQDASWGDCCDFKSAQ